MDLIAQSGSSTNQTMLHCMPTAPPVRIRTQAEVELRWKGCVHASDCSGAVIRCCGRCTGIAAFNGVMVPRTTMHIGGLPGHQGQFILERQGVGREGAQSRISSVTDYDW